MLIKLLEEPKLQINKETLDKMEEIVKQATQEIGWLGEVERDGIDYLLTDVHIFKQEVHSTTCELNAENMMQFIEESGNYELINKLRFWGHSHVNMGVSPSGQDEKQFKELAENSPFFIRMIINKKKEMKIDVIDKEKGYTINDINVVIMYDKDILDEIEYCEKRIKEIQDYIEELTKPDKDLETFVKKEIKEKVSKLCWTTPTTHYAGYSKSWWLGNNSSKKKSLSKIEREEEVEEFIYKMSIYELERLLTAITRGEDIKKCGVFTLDEIEYLKEYPEIEDEFVESIDLIQDYIEELSYLGGGYYGK